MPAAQSATSTSAALGPELDNREWLMVRSKYHEIYYDRSADPRLVTEVYQLIDNIYDFLVARSPEKLTTPVKAFLMPRERGRSRCSPRDNAMRTGADGDVRFIVSSLLHEETHLFNFASLRAESQSWWAGEFSCVYFQERARIAGEGSDLKAYIKSHFPNGPTGRLADLSQYGSKALDDALAAMYFLEETYGRQRLDDFRSQCLRDVGGRSGPRILQKVYGKDAAMLDREWRSFYGWNAGAAGSAAPSHDPLQARVTYSNAKASVQFIIRDLGGAGGTEI